MVTAETSAPRQAEVAIAAPGLRPGVPTGPNLILLRAVFGQDEANHGTERYLVDKDGLVRVPSEALGPLITVGGFVLANSGADPISAGSLKLHHDDAARCSHAGREYLSDPDGNVLVPAEATCELLAHGFVPVEEGIAASNRVVARGAVVR